MELRTRIGSFPIAPHNVTERVILTTMFPERLEEFSNPGNILISIEECCSYS